MGFSSRIGCRVCVLLCLVMIFGCTKQNAPVQSVDATLSATEHWRLGLDKAEARDYAGALAEIAAAHKSEPELKYEIALAHIHFLNKDVDDATERYRALIASGKLSDTQKAELEAEVARIEKADGDVIGRSVAGQWVRSTAAVIIAEEAIEKKDFDTAYKSYDKAYQYNQDYTLLFESALAASKAEQWQWAHKKFKEYTAVGRSEISRDMMYRIVAETERIMSLLKGQDVVTEKSLADEIYGERSGEEETDGLPPSMQEEVTTGGEVSQSGEADSKAVAVGEGGEDATRVPETEKQSEAERKKAEKESLAAVAAEKKRLAKEQRKKEAEARRLAKEAERRERAEARKAESEKRRLAREKKVAEAEAARKERAEKKRMEREEAKKKAKEARERKLALKKEKEEKRKAAIEAKKQKEKEAKAALAAEREAAKKAKEDAKAKRAEEKRRLEEETRLAKEAAAREIEIARQEKEAARREAEAERKEKEAKRLSQQERLEEEKRSAAEADRQKAEAERKAAQEAREKAKEERARLKEERRLAAVAKKAAEKERRTELKRQQEEKKKQKAEEKKRKIEERKALAAQKLAEQKEQKRLEAEQKKAEQEERAAERARKKAERELALQEKEREAELKVQKAAEKKEAKRIAREEAKEQKRIAREEEAEAKRLKQEERMAKRKADREKDLTAQTKDADAPGKSASPGDAEAASTKSAATAPLIASTTVEPSAMETTFEDLLFYSSSKSATVRYKAVRELIPLKDDKARVALENRVVNDRNMHVRFLAISGLVQRDSLLSIPVLEHAVMTAATSQERAMLKSAISEIRLRGNRK